MAISLLAANNAQTVLASGISSTATTLSVNTGTGVLFPSPVSGSSFFKLTLIDSATGTLTEIVHVTQRSGDTMTIERGQEGTAPRIWSANDIAANMMTAGTLTYIVGNLQPLNANLTALSALIGAANKLPYFTGAGLMANTDLTAAGRDLISQANVAAMLTYLGLGDGSEYLEKSSNLSDLPDKPLSRTNLGVPAGVDKQMCTAWVSWEIAGGTASIQDSYGVSSVTRTSIGVCKVNFSTPMANANYAPNYTSSQGDPTISGGSVTTKSISSVDTLSWSGTGIGSGVVLNAADHFRNSVTIFGGK